MKYKMFSILSFYLIIFFSQRSFSQDTQTRTIYDFYSDDHENGRWKGYSYFLTPLISSEGEISLKFLEANETGIYIEDNVFTPNQFIFACDYDENLPCSVVQFKKMFNVYYESFIKNIDLLINKKNIADSGDQCLVLQIRQGEKSAIYPYLLCINIEGQGINLKSAVFIFILFYLFSQIQFY